MTKTGTYTLDETLHILGSGRIDATGGGITLNIVVGDLVMDTPTVSGGGQIEANDPATPTGNSASAIAITVAGNMLMNSGTVIEARNTVSAGSGAKIDITVAGNLSMAGASGSTPGARVDSSASGASNNKAGNLAFTVGGNMEMGSGAVIKAESAQNDDGGSITISVTGSLTLHGTIPGPPVVSGAIISSSVPGGTGGNAGAITVNVGNCDATPPTGDLVVEPGAKVQANSLKGAGGAIVMNSCRHIRMDGLVESASGRSGTGAIQGPGGGTITLDAGCDLTVSDDGKVSSRGQDPGADLVHLEGGCSVLIFDLVESTGPGHAVPNNPVNHCNNLNRPDKHPSSTTCVEVWAGDSLTIDSDADEGHNGEVSADGGPGGRGWIDLFARGDITIDGDATGPFAVHANRAGGTDQVGGNVTVKSTEGKVTASDLAISADGNVAGGTGGWIIVEAKLDVLLDTASLFARGDFAAMGGYGKGGQVSIRSFAGTLSWQNGVGDVQPTGTGIANPGVITLQDCTSGSIDKTGTSFPVTAGSATTPTELADSCGGAPTLPTYVTLPECACACTLIVEKQTIPPNDPQLFTFTGDAADTIGDDEQIVVGGLLPGTYNSTETVPLNWQLIDITCNDTSSANPSSGDLASGKATFHLEAGEVVKCTFTDEKSAGPPPGTIVVEKQTIPPNDPQLFTFTGDAADTIGDDEQIVVGGLLPGTYNSTETVPLNWQLIDITCNDTSSANPSSGDLASGKATFHLEAGEVVKCTFTDEKSAGPPPPPAVGGELYSVDKSALVRPYVGLLGLLAAVAAAVAITRGRRP